MDCLNIFSGLVRKYAIFRTRPKNSSARDDLIAHPRNMTALFPRASAAGSSELNSKSAESTFKCKMRFYRCQESFSLYNRYRRVCRLQLVDSKNPSVSPYPFKAASSIRATLKGYGYKIE